MRLLPAFLCLACTSPSPGTVSPPVGDEAGTPLALIQSTLVDAPALEPREFSVRRDQRIELRLKHEGKTMIHRLQLLPPVDEEDQQPLVVFGVLKPGQSALRVFKAPTQPGRYPIQCTSKDYTPGPCGVLRVQ